ncbi:MAG: YlxR family protein [Ruminococcaceae bacterium]|nr:YlxR family protein [Oscillospiraceae bacterium]
MQQVQKKSPERRCTGCGETRLKKDLIRVLRAPDGTLSVDTTGKKSGRGAYICNKKECFIKAKKSRRIESSLKCQISDELYNQLEQQIEVSSDE